MATLTHNNVTYTVDSAVRGYDYIVGLKGGAEVVKFNGITDFSLFSYSGTYVDPTATQQTRTIRFTTTDITSGAVSSEAEGSIVAVYEV